MSNRREQQPEKLGVYCAQLPWMLQHPLPSKILNPLSKKMEKPVQITALSHRRLWPKRLRKTA